LLTSKDGAALGSEEGAALGSSDGIEASSSSRSSTSYLYLTTRKADGSSAASPSTSSAGRNSPLVLEVSHTVLVSTAVGTADGSADAVGREVGTTVALVGETVVGKMEGRAVVGDMEGRAVGRAKLL
jgi:hypothetical protein